MRIYQLLCAIAFVSASVSLAAGQTVVTVDVDLIKSNAIVDGLFVSNSMPHMMSKWDSLPYNDPTFRELCKALAPSSLRVLANPLFHSKTGSRRKKRSHREAYGEGSKYSSSKDNKFTNATHKEDSIPVEDFKDLPAGQGDRAISNHRQSDHNTSGHGDSADEKENHAGLKHEKAQGAAHRRAAIMVFASKSEGDMPVAKWEKLYSFMQYVGWDIFMDFTNVHRHANNSWDTTQAKAFLKYAAERNIKIPDFSIGNEPNRYHKKYNMTNITPKATVGDYKDLRTILDGFSQYKNSTVSGPETTRPSASAPYFIDFAKYGGCALVDEYSFHQYYRALIADKPTVADFLNISIMNLMYYQINVGRKYMAQQKCFKPIRITETSTVAGGLDNVADRFVAGFLWLDKLGVAARGGVTRVYRFNLWGVSYSLLNRQTFKPNPDYFLTVLFKRLVEGPVFNVTSSSNDLRAYANCVRPLLYPKGPIVIYVLNVRKDPLTLFLKQFQNSTVDTYFFTPGDTLGVLARTVKVNGILMKYTAGDNLTFTPRPAKGNSILMPAQSFGFMVLPKSSSSICREMKTSSSSSPAAVEPLEKSVHQQQPPDEDMAPSASKSKMSSTSDSSRLGFEAVALLTTALFSLNILREDHRLTSV